MSVLSGGGVGIGDEVSRVDVELVATTCRQAKSLEECKICARENVDDDISKTSLYEKCPWTVRGRVEGTCFLLVLNNGKSLSCSRGQGRGCRCLGPGLSC